MPPLPTTIDGLNIRQWETFEPYFEQLSTQEVDASNSREWLEEWSHLTKVMRESVAYTYIQRTLDTADPEREAAFLDIVKQVQPPAIAADHELKQRLLQMDVDDDGLAVMIRDLRSEADLFSAENIPLITELQTLKSEYDKITGGMSADWDGEQQNLSRLGVHLESKDRAKRQRAWVAIMELWQESREQLNALYLRMLPMRVKLAENAGLDNFRTYVFQEKKRFEYSPADCTTFHEAIEATFVPASQRILARKREQMGVGQLRPWDWVPEMGKIVDASGKPALRPFTDQEDLTRHSIDIFNNLDPELGRYFAIMADDGLLDLDTRQGKSLGGYCYGLPLRQKPFIFMNSAGTSKNVQTLLHEAGHAFHGFEAMRQQPLVWQQRAPMEFNEVASMAMELLAAPYLTTDKGGFYTPAQAAQHRIAHLEKIILFPPYMAVVDAFQHWVYTHAGEIDSTEILDQKWDELCQRFLPNVDWTGLEHIRMSGWHRKPHIFRSPFYYIEYGMAQMGALQIWRNSLNDPDKALTDYRHALSLGGTRTLPELFNAAGAEFRFDVDLLSELVDLMEGTIEQLTEQL